MKAGVRDKPDITAGNHKCSGAAPNFRHIAIGIRICMLLEWYEIKAPMMKIVDPNDCGTKYFTTVSDSLAVIL